MGGLKRFGRLLFGLAFLGLAAVVMSNAAGIQAELNRAVGPNPQCSWTSVKGGITTSQKENRVSPNGEEDWGFEVGFTYAVGGLRHTGSQWLPDFLGSSNEPVLFQNCAKSRDMTETVALFGAAHGTSGFISDRPVIVYFNPQNADEAVLVPGMVLGAPISYGEVIVLYGVLLLGLLGIVVLYAGIRGLLESSPTSTADVPAVVRLNDEIADLERQREALIQARPRPPAAGHFSALLVLGVAVSAVLMAIVPALVLANGLNPVLYGAPVLGLGLFVALAVLERRHRSDVKRWDEDNRGRLKAIDEHLAAKAQEVRTLKERGGA